jgi:hypothetical protein
LNLVLRDDGVFPEDFLTDDLDLRVSPAQCHAVLSKMLE